MKTWQKYVAEAYGTLVLVGIGTGTLMALGATNLEADIATVAFAFGLGWMASLFTVGRVSGAHCNPVLTLAAFLNRRIGLRDMIGYWAGQFAGATAALLIFAWVLDRSAVATSYTYLAQPTVQSVTGFLAEAIFTMVLTAAFLALTESRGNTNHLALGITLSALTFIGLRFTGASMNPFRSLAPALVGDDIAGFPFGSAEAWWVFLAGPFLGAIMGWIVYKFVVEGDTDLSDDLDEIRVSVM